MSEIVSGALKKHNRVRKIEEEYSGGESNCELSEISMLLRTPQKTARKGPGSPTGSRPAFMSGT